MNKSLNKRFTIGTAFVIYLVAGWFYPLLGYFIPFCMLAGILIASSKGRKWCDWYCPRGSFYDSLLKSVSPKKDIPAFLRKMNVRVAVLTVLMTMMTIQIVTHYPDPFKIGKIFIMLLTATTIIGIILGLLAHQRSWCYVCPVGTLSNFAGRNKFPLKIDEDKCVNCKICAKNCPIQLEPYKPNNHDCLKCGNCVEICPKKALSF